MLLQKKLTSILTHNSCSITSFFAKNKTENLAVSYIRILRLQHSKLLEKTSNIKTKEES